MLVPDHVWDDPVSKISPVSPGFRVLARNEMLLDLWSLLGMAAFSHSEEVIRFLGRVKKLKKYQAVFRETCPRESGEQESWIT